MYSHVSQTDTISHMHFLVCYVADKSKLFTCCYTTVSNCCDICLGREQFQNQLQSSTKFGQKEEYCRKEIKDGVIALHTNS